MNGIPSPGSGKATMDIDNFKRKFNTPEEAQAFLNTVPELFEDDDLLAEFTAACVEAQAALADWLIKEAQFVATQRNKYLGGRSPDKQSQIEIAAAWDDYNRASIEFQMATRKLREILNHAMA